MYDKEKEFFQKSLKDSDPILYDLCHKERQRQHNTIDLIASENRVSKAVLDVELASLLTNKYVEGYPGDRYYQGCIYADEIERLAIERVTKLFNCNYANVQVHSGSQANQAVYFALLKPGDTILGFDLSAGGHLTHGSKVNQSGKWFNAVSYGVNKTTFLIDMEEVARLATEYKPKIIIAGASSYTRHIDFAAFRTIADKVGAYLLVDMAHYSGLVAGGAYPSPMKYADIVTSTTHKVLRGPRGGVVLTNREDIITKINKAVFPGIQGGALMHLVAAKAAAFGEALKDDFKVYATNIVKNAVALGNGLKECGIDVCTGGTDTHIVLVDLRSNNIKGNVAAKKLEEVGIICNKNSLPFDNESPFVTSGIRLGTASETTRGFNTLDFKNVASLIADVLLQRRSIEEIKKVVHNLCNQYPFYA